MTAKTAPEQLAGAETAPAMSSLALWRYVFKKGLPVLFSYLPVGFAFGMAFVDRMGCGWYWAVICSALMVAVASEFVLLGLMIMGAGLPGIALAMPLINARFMFLGLTLVERYRSVPLLQRLYLIFSLTPGAYSLVTTTPVPEGVHPTTLYLRLTGLCHFYTIMSTLIGAVAGAVFRVNTEGFEFALTALFTVFLIEQWYIVRRLTPFVVAFVCGAAMLVVLPADNFLLATLTLTLILILGMKPWLKPAT